MCTEIKRRRCMFANASCKFWSDKMPLFMISIAENLYEFFFFFLFDSFVACLKSSIHVVEWFDFQFYEATHTSWSNTSIDFHKCNVNAIQFSLPQIRFDFHFCFKSYFIDISCSQFNSIRWKLHDSIPRKKNVLGGASAFFFPCDS